MPSPAPVTDWVKLKFAAMNLKKTAKWLWMEYSPPLFFMLFYLFYVENPVSAYV